VGGRAGGRGREGGEGREGITSHDDNVPARGRGQEGLAGGKEREEEDRDPHGLI
jgi:hypothetical protein